MINNHASPEIGTCSSPSPGLLFLKNHHRSYLWASPFQNPCGCYRNRLYSLTLYLRAHRASLCHGFAHSSGHGHAPWTSPYSRRGGLCYGGLSPGSDAPLLPSPLQASPLLSQPEKATTIRTWPHKAEEHSSLLAQPLVTTDLVFGEEFPDQTITNVLLASDMGLRPLKDIVGDEKGAALLAELHLLLLRDHGELGLNLVGQSRLLEVENVHLQARNRSFG